MTAWPDLRGKRAFVTGGTSGLGRAMALALAGAGVAVAAGGRGGGDPETAGALRRAGVTPFACDLGDPEALARGVDRVLDHLGGIDILIGNAGLRDRRPLDLLDDAAVDRMFAVNLSANLRLARRIAPGMAKAGGGAMIFVSSTAATRAAPGNASYAAAKGGLSALTRALACELGPANIRCNAIAPGYFATEFNRALQERAGDNVTRRIPLRRWGKPEEIAGAALFLASSASSYVNGHVLTVDGGATTAI